MKNAKEYFENRSFGHDDGTPMVEIIRAKVSEEEAQLIIANKENELFHRPMYELKEIKNRFCLSWSEMQHIVRIF